MINVTNDDHGYPWKKPQVKTPKKKGNESRLTPAKKSIDKQRSSLDYMETNPSNGVTESLVWRIQHTIFALHCTTVVVTNVSSYCHLVVRRFCNFSDGWKWMEMGWDDEMIPMLSYVLTALENTMARDAIQWSNQHFFRKKHGHIRSFPKLKWGVP